MTPNFRPNRPILSILATFGGIFEDFGHYFDTSASPMAINVNFKCAPTSFDHDFR